MDLLRLETSEGNYIYSFLSFAWGVIADCDINSEKLRWIGELRYDLYGAYYWLKYKRQK